MNLNDKQKKGILFSLLFILGLQVFYVAVYGFTTTPFYDAEYDIDRCPDWRFHVCFATCLDSKQCSWLEAFPGFEDVGGQPNYSYYAPLMHLFAFGLSWLSSLPVLFWIAITCSASICLLASLLWRHSGSLFGAIVSTSMFLIALPLALVILFNNPAYSWLDLTLCGLIPFVLASALFIFLILEARNLSFKWAFIIFASIVFSHNYGFLLALLALASLVIEFYSRNRIKATWVAVTAVFVWIVWLSPSYFTFASERIIFLLYFLMSLELGRLLSNWKKGVV